MDTKIKLGLGSMLAIVGALGLILGPTIGVTALERPWSFIAGFLVGVSGGMGATLVIAGLLEYRRL